MACFDITRTLCDDLNSIVNRFWWSQMDKENKIQLMSWEILSKPKSEGGLGFRDLHSFNLAMLARLAWRLLQNASSVCAQVLAAKYHPRSCILEARPKNGISYTWRSILKGVQLLKKGVIWRVGDGSNINIWSDPWIPRGITWRVSSHEGKHLVTKANELINPITNSWDTDLVYQTFNADDAETILKIPILENTNDFIAWHFDKKGFLVKSAYRVASDYARRDPRHGLASCSEGPGKTSNFNWKNIWALPLPNNVLHFLWRMATHSLPLKTRLKHRGMEVDTLRPACYRFDEDGGHFFLKYKKFKNMWRMAQMEHTRLKLIQCPDPFSLFEEVLKLEEEERIKEHKGKKNDQETTC